MQIAGPLDRFIALAEEIFEAEDGLPPEVDISELPELFSRSTIDCSRPLLHPDIIRKLTRRVGQVARPSKRNRSISGVLATPKGKGRMTEVDTDVLSRMLRVLNRTVKAGEDIDPFAQRNPKPASPTKKKKVGKSQEPDSQATEVEAEHPELAEEDVQKTNRLLEGQRDSVLAAECCVALLSSDRLTKQVINLRHGLHIFTHTLASCTPRSLSPYA
jgi:cohesin loading factor subunit SCC2